ncbi:hypothetical protein [Halosimplex sp. J119]
MYKRWQWFTICLLAVATGGWTAFNTGYYVLSVARTIGTFLVISVFGLGAKSGAAKLPLRPYQIEIFRLTSGLVTAVAIASGVVLSPFGVYLLGMALLYPTLLVIAGVVVWASRMQDSYRFRRGVTLYSRER